MAFIRAIYNNKVVTKIDDLSELTTNQNKYWLTESGVSETLGVWDDVNNKFIPDGIYDEDTGWLWPEDLDWSNYDG